MTAARIAIIACFALLIGVPLLVRPAEHAAAPAGAPNLIIITPHNEQIRFEFARAFNDWHEARFGQPVNVIYTVPGGTSEIRKMLESQFTKALEDGREPGGDADLVFGGGSFEHDRLKRGVTVDVDGQKRHASISVPVDFDQPWLDETYGDNVIGDGKLYDPDRHWFGIALSGFGIVYNRDVLAELSVSEPDAWDDLCDPRLRGWVALVNPGQSGSVTTAFESILKRSGWLEGWRILRRAGANARYFSASSLKPPLDVGQGNAAMGVSIDFLGRYQAQALKEASAEGSGGSGGRANEGGRLGYVDPRAGSTIDADPISMLRNAPHPELAHRFIEFALSDEGQALWQFRSEVRDQRSEIRDQRSAGNSDLRPLTSDLSALGPRQFELRRMPVRRAIYERYADRFIDRVNPFEFATPMEHPNPHFRDFIAPMFSAMAMDQHETLEEAWDAIVTHPAYPRDTGGRGIVIADDVADPALREMLRLFDAMPIVPGPGGASFDLAETSALGDVRAGWLQGKWADARLWHPQASPQDALRRMMGAFFSANYCRIVELADQSRKGVTG